MEFEDEKKSNTLDIIVILAGLAFLFWIFKSNQQKTQSQQIQSQQTYPQDYPLSTYENAEEWHIVRGDNGFIEDLKVGRNATVGNSLQPSVQHEKSAIGTNIDTNMNSYIDNRIKQMMQKNIEKMGKYNRFERLNDRDRSRRFGFA